MVNREDVIEYLLHRMPEAERAAFAERWFNDPEEFERVQMAEAELLDEYVRGSLSRTQRRQVERFLLGSDLQRRKLQFAAALGASLPGQSRSRSPWMYIAAAALLAGIGISLWLGLENRKLQTEVAHLEARVHLQTGGVYTLELPADTLRSASPEYSVRLAPSTRLLRLVLELKPGDEKSAYSVTVSADGRSVWSEGPLRPEKDGSTYIAPVWIPASVLTPGDYTVRLESAGNPVAYYQFAFAP